MKNLPVMVLALGLATPALATHNVPSKAKQLKLSFVTAYNNCTAPNTNHKPAIALPACAPPAPSTNNNPAHEITFGPKGAMTVQVKAKKGNISISVKGADIQDYGTPFSGSLDLSGTVRWSDHGCGSPAFTTPCTMFDFPFPISVNCTAGTCSAKTDVNTVIPGSFTSGDEANVEVGQLQINDPDGDAAFREGLLVP